MRSEKLAVVIPALSSDIILVRLLHENILEKVIIRNQKRELFFVV